MSLNNCKKSYLWGNNFFNYAFVYSDTFIEIQD